MSRKHQSWNIFYNDSVISNEWRVIRYLYSSCRLTESRLTEISHSVRTAVAGDKGGFGRPGSVWVAGEPPSTVPWMTHCSVTAMAVGSNQLMSSGAGLTVSGRAGGLGVKLRPYANIETSTHWIHLSCKSQQQHTAMRTMLHGEKRVNGVTVATKFESGPFQL